MFKYYQIRFKYYIIYAYIVVYSSRAFSEKSRTRFGEPRWRYATRGAAETPSGAACVIIVTLVSLVVVVVVVVLLVLILLLLLSLLILSLLSLLSLLVVVVVVVVVCLSRAPSPTPRHRSARASAAGAPGGWPCRCCY